MCDKNESHSVPETNVGQEKVYCQRLKRPLEVNEHGRCLYCYGDTADILTGDYEIFCDFNSDEDPISFGFPSDNIRDLDG